MTELLFDQPFYIAINEARWRVVEELLAVARHAGPVHSILDAGCGPGWFAGRLAQAGLDVLGVDAREELVAEARRRAPEARFETFDFDGADLAAAPEPRDAVLAFGLLYHLENPLRALRLLRACGRGPLLLETMTIPEPGLLARLVAENPNETQGFHGLALVLTPEAVAQALFVVGYRHVYRYTGAVGHADFADGEARLKRRDIFFAADRPAEHAHLAPVRAAPIGRYDYARRA